jgi:type I restriction enzyme R subunit
VAGADRGHRQPGAIAGRQQAARPDPDGHRQRQDLHRISFIYRLIKHAGAQRVLFLVDRRNLGRQTKKEFRPVRLPYNNYKFGEEYIVQHLQSNQLDRSAACASAPSSGCTPCSRAASRVRPDEEQSHRELGAVQRQPRAHGLQPQPPASRYFDIIVTDEAHRSIYNLWRQVLEYFDAYLIGLTATPNKQTFGFFNQNLVMEYGHEQAVADGVNVNYDVYRIRTRISEQGSKVEAGYWVQAPRARHARRALAAGRRLCLRRPPSSTARADARPDPHRGAHLARPLAPRSSPAAASAQDPGLRQGRQPRRSHREILREEFGRGNEFARRSPTAATGATPPDLISAFRNSYYPRIAVTVDMIATGTDIKPVESSSSCALVKSAPSSSR